MHFPSGDFNANGAWTVFGALAHNLLRWTQLIGLPNSTVRAARTLRRRLITIAGRLTRHGRCWTFISPPAGPGKATTSPRSPGSARSPPPEPRRRQVHRPSQPTRPTGAISAAREHHQRLRETARPTPRSPIDTHFQPQRAITDPATAIRASAPAIRWIRAKQNSGMIDEPSASRSSLCGADSSCHRRQQKPRFLGRCRAICGACRRRQRPGAAALGTDELGPWRCLSPARTRPGHILFPAALPRLPPLTSGTATSPDMSTTLKPNAIAKPDRGLPLHIFVLFDILARHSDALGFVAERKCGRWLHVAD